MQNANRTLLERLIKAPYTAGSNLRLLLQYCLSRTGALNISWFRQTKTRGNDRSCENMAPLYWEILTNNKLSYREYIQNALSHKKLHLIILYKSLFTN